MGPPWQPFKLVQKGTRVMIGAKAKIPAAEFGDQRTQRRQDQGDKNAPQGYGHLQDSLFHRGWLQSFITSMPASTSVQARSLGPPKGSLR
ncbi:hypothetical protein WR25_27212 [Diploscapter pachys]|uniref:Uncharacterized protein n=1 Tax=Diploscapter pachys TaxID=2018661 RepID=A0A2A2K8L4_9BILA|nr:hypothetical protein WR25_27212 [Diploscapter pachys]